MKREARLPIASALVLIAAAALPASGRQLAVRAAPLSADRTAPGPPSAGLAAPAAAEAQDWFPFAPSNLSVAPLLDLSDLNPSPAGSNGFLVARDGHLMDGKSRRVRLLGINLHGTECAPARPDADALAARLHRLGINAVRLSDMPVWSALEGSSASRPDPQPLDRLDYLVSRLKARGIYLQFALPSGAGAGGRSGGGPEAGTAARAARALDPGALGEVKRLARNLLSHTNPYTRLRYADEPALVAVEIDDADLLVSHAWAGGLSDLPAEGRRALQAGWNAWLKARHGTTDSLRTAWISEDKPLGPNLLQNADFERGAEHWKLIRTNGAQATMRLLPEPGPDAKSGGHPVAIGIQVAPARPADIVLTQSGVDLTEGEPYTLSLRAGSSSRQRIRIQVCVDSGDRHPAGLDTRIDVQGAMREYRVAFTASRVLNDHAALTFTLGAGAGELTFAGIALRPGVETTLPEGATLEAGTVPCPEPVQTPAGREWLAYLLQTDRTYVEAIRDAVRATGAHALISGAMESSGGLAGAVREAALDVSAVQASWRPAPPDFAADTAMVSDAAGDLLPGMARCRNAGRPLFVAAVSEPGLNAYRTELLPLAASFAAEQDWDALTIEEGRRERSEGADGGPQPTEASSFTSSLILTDPALLAMLPAAAMAFERDDMPIANEEVRMRLAIDRIPELLAVNGPDILAEWSSAAVAPSDAFSKRLSVAFTAQGGLTAPPPAKSRPHAEEFIHPPDANGPLTWRAGPSALFTADSPSSKLFVGMAGGDTENLSGFIVKLDSAPGSFAAVALTALDGRTVERSRSLLLTAVGRMRNTEAEAVPAHVTVHTLGAHATITALDAGGHPLGRIPSKLAKGALTFDLPAGGRSLWYSIETDANFITPEEPVRPKRPHRHTPPPPAPPPRTGEGGLTGGRYASSEASSMPAFPPVVRGTPPIAGESSCREHALNASY
jgi:hypothetical protein